MNIEISNDIDNVQIQVEYSFYSYTIGSNATEDKETVMVRTFPKLMEAISPNKLKQLKEDYEADEVHVTNIVIISEVNENQVVTHLNHEVMVTTVQPKESFL